MMEDLVVLLKERDAKIRVMRDFIKLAIMDLNSPPTLTFPTVRLRAIGKLTRALNYEPKNDDDDHVPF